MNFFRPFMQFTRRNPVMVVSIVVIVALGSTSYYLWQRQQSLTGEHDDVRRNGEDIIQSLTSHARITAEIATVNNALEYIDRNLINEGDLAENLGYFYQIESSSKLRFAQLNQLSSQPQPPGANYKSVPFSLRATGSYRQIVRLIHELETGPHLLRIRTYSLTQNEGEPDSVTFEATVELLARP